MSTIQQNQVSNIFNELKNGDPVYLFINICKDAKTSETYLELELAKKENAATINLQDMNHRIPYSMHANNYTIIQIKEIVNNFMVRDIKLPNGDIVPASMLRERRNEPYSEAVSKYPNKYAKEILFFLKRTKMKKFYKKLARFNFVVPGKVNGCKIEYATYQDADKEYYLAFTDSSEYYNFINNQNNHIEKDGYKPIVVSFKEILEKMNNNKKIEGLWFDISSNTILGKKFDLKLSKKIFSSLQ